VKISARNQLAGVVRKVTHGPINSEVVVQVAPDVELTAVVTRASAEHLELQEERQVVAIIKASHIMLAVE
jgi:molybdopterin-binding protein